MAIVVAAAVLAVAVAVVAGEFSELVVVVVSVDYLPLKIVFLGKCVILG